jgi:hypothetical protein
VRQLREHERLLVKTELVESHEKGEPFRWPSASLSEWAINRPESRKVVVAGSLRAIEDDNCQP